MMVGRKRVALVDADGVWLAVATVPASVQERDTLPALDGGSTHWPSLRLAIFDGGFTADRCREWANFHGMRHHVVSREPGQKGFVVLPRRWVVERSFGWLAHWGGLLRDRAGRLDVSSKSHIRKEDVVARVYWSNVAIIRGWCTSSPPWKPATATGRGTTRRRVRPSCGPTAANACTTTSTSWMPRLDWSTCVCRPGVRSGCNSTATGTTGWLAS